MLFGTAFKTQRRCPFVDTHTKRRTTNEHHEGDLFEVEVKGGLKSRLGSALSAGQIFFFFDRSIEPPSHIFFPSVRSLFRPRTLFSIYFFLFLSFQKNFRFFSLLIKASPSSLERKKQEKASKNAFAERFFRLFPPHFSNVAMH